jgi:hypothetical protein
MVRPPAPIGLLGIGVATSEGQAHVPFGGMPQPLEDPQVPCRCRRTEQFIVEGMVRFEDVVDSCAGMWRPPPDDSRGSDQRTDETNTGGGRGDQCALYPGEWYVGRQRRQADAKAHREKHREDRDELGRLRDEFYDSLSARADALFELTDALLCAGEPVRTLVELSLTGEHRRGNGALYDGLVCYRIDFDRIRRSLSTLTLPRDQRRIVLAVDISAWPATRNGRPPRSWRSTQRRFSPRSGSESSPASVPRSA